MAVATEQQARWKALLTDRAIHERDWQDLRDLLLPSANDIQTQRRAGESRTRRLFDTTGSTGIMTLAANMMGAITNPAIEWFRLRFRLEELNQDQDVALWQ